MLKYSSKTLFITILMLSTFMVASSSNWLSMWLGLEINLMAFIPLMSKWKNYLSSESCMIYFMTQAMSSSILLFALIMKSGIMTFEWMQQMMNHLMMISILIKLGIPPFHLWFTEVMNKMEWNNCLLLMTWQKIAPMMMLSYLQFPILLVPLITMIGSIGGINQTSLRKIMAFSSINHMGWMLACMTNTNMWMVYLSIYMLITWMMIQQLLLKSSYFINQMNMETTTMWNKITTISLFMSMGGLPPFLGFMPKWMVIIHMVEKNNFTIITIMVMTSLLTLFYYLRLMNSILLVHHSSQKWMIKKSSSYNQYIIIVNMLLPFALILV